MRKVRRNCYFTRELAHQLAEEAARQGVHLSQLVEAAAAASLAPDALARRKDAHRRRLDHMSKQIAELTEEVRFAVEAQATFVQTWLRMTGSLPDNPDPIARTRGVKRFDKYLENVGDALPDGGAFHRAMGRVTWARAAVGSEEDRTAREDAHVSTP